MSGEENEKVIELDYLETPKGAVARFEGVRQLAEVLAEVIEEIDKMKERLENLPESSQVPEGLERRLKYIEEQLMVLSDDVREILNALGELSATVAQIKKALKL
ncbi:MAG: hypothetical protein QXE96_03305 [Candidatus Caldarchaeum sp.]